MNKDSNEPTYQLHPIHGEGIPTPPRWPCRLGVDTWSKLVEVKKKNHQGEVVEEGKKPKKKKKKGKEPQKFKEVEYIYTPRHVPTLCLTWTNPREWLPIPYELCWLLVRGRDEDVPGWWADHYWDGRLLKDDDEVISWRVFSEQKDEIQSEKSPSW